MTKNLVEQRCNGLSSDKENVTPNLDLERLETNVTEAQDKAQKVSDSENAFGASDENVKFGMKGSDIESI